MELILGAAIRRKPSEANDQSPSDQMGLKLGRVDCLARRLMMERRGICRWWVESVVAVGHSIEFSF